MLLEERLDDVRATDRHRGNVAARVYHTTHHRIALVGTEQYERNPLTMRLLHHRKRKRERK